MSGAWSPLEGLGGLEAPHLLSLSSLSPGKAWPSALLPGGRHQATRSQACPLTSPGAAAVLQRLEAGALAAGSLAPPLGPGQALGT